MTPWSPWLTGAAIGALDALSFAARGEPLGVTTPFESGAVLAARRIAPTAANSFVLARGTSPRLDSKLFLIVGIAVGSALTARSAARASTVSTGRYLRAFAGGALMMFGARAAKGCTSGHAISGTMQLAASSLVFSSVMAASAAATTWLRRSR